MSIALNGDGIISGVSSITVGAGASVFSPAANTLALGTNGTEKVRVDSSGVLTVKHASSYGQINLDGAAASNDYGRINFQENGTTKSYITDNVIGNSLVIGGSRYFSILTNGSERLRVLSGGGLTFNGDTAAANALDDYEEGTWTPSFQTTNNNATIANTSVSHAVYTKIGNRVFGSARFYALVTSKGTGNVQITGLPFTVPSSNPAQGEVHCTIAFAIRFSTAAPVSAITLSNSTRIELLTGNTDATTGGLYTAMPAANLSLENANNIISISFSYSVA